MISPMLAYAFSIRPAMLPVASRAITKRGLALSMTRCADVDCDASAFALSIRRLVPPDTGTTALEPERLGSPLLNLSNLPNRLPPWPRINPRATFAYSGGQHEAQIRALRRPERLGLQVRRHLARPATGQSRVATSNQDRPSGICLLIRTMADVRRRVSVIAEYYLQTGPLICRRLR